MNPWHLAKWKGNEPMMALSQMKKQVSNPSSLLTILWSLCCILSQFLPLTRSLPLGWGHVCSFLRQTLELWFCWYFLFLSSWDSLRFLNLTTSEVANESASDNFLVLLSLHDWQYHKFFLLIRVLVEPESTNTFSIFQDFTEEIVSLVRMCTKMLPVINNR